MNHRSLVRFGIRALLVWVVVSLAMLAAQRSLMALLLPYFDLVIRLLQSDLSPTLRLTEEGGSWLIQMTPFLLRPVGLTDQLALRPFIALEPISVHVDHALVPLVLLITAVASWPFASRIEALVRVLLAAPAVPALLALTTPVLLTGLAQMSIVELALKHGANFHEPGLVTLLIFMESGGRWLLPLALAVACVVASGRICRRQPPAENQTEQPRAHTIDAAVFAPVDIQRAEPTTGDPPLALASAGAIESSSHRAAPDDTVSAVQ
jgi:hypothetical protein